MSILPIIATLFLMLAIYCGIDPFKHSAISSFPDFQTHKVDLCPWSELPKLKDEKNLLQKSEIKFLGEIQGPESILFDLEGKGPYTGLADGRVVVWSGDEVGWKEFAVTSPYRSAELCGPKPTPLGYLKNEHICGRPLGLRFDKKTGDLYIADAYFGLLKVGSEGGLATRLVTEAEGIPLKFTNDLDIDDEGNIYFTDSSSIYQRRNFMQLVFSAEDSGRLLKYDPTAKQTTVLLKNLQFPNGVSMSKDKSFFVFSEGSVGRLRKYWIKGEKAYTSEVFATLPGFPDNVRTNDKGEFWVGIHCRRSMYNHIVSLYPQLRKFLLKLPIPTIYQYLMHIGGRPHGMVVKFSPEGELVQVLEDSQGKVVKAVSEAEEKDGKLWIGSVLMPFIAVYEL